MTPKLKLCCEALDAFSAADNWPHGTKPSSLNGVTARRLEALVVLLEVWLPCVA